ncbi:MAG TPA: sensor histidine kinase, partial [Allosphingosinicella sp.]
TEEYLDIESVRFGDRLDVEVDCSDAACEALIPSFLVQPLVENAIKHGVARTRGPTKININGEVKDCALRITVANCVSADQTAPTHPSSGVGLINVRQRLEAVYGKAANLEAGVKGDRYQAVITIPVCRTPQEA